MEHTKTSANVSRRRNRLHRIKSVLLVGLLVLLITISNLFQQVIIGEIAIGIYGLVALLFKIPSATTFKMVFITLVAIPFVAIFRPDSDLGDTFAVYAYLLLAIGILSAVIEYWRNNRKTQKKVM